jgi:sugar lactone lactonase YvrE
MAQPSGLTSDGTCLYVADSETSSLRSVSLGPGGGVETLVGQGLFEFGDVDGKGSRVRLQHPLGISHQNGILYLADSYNHKIKTLDLSSRRVRTLLGDGEPGFADGRRARFSEPGGVSVSGNYLFVADTNNHAIRRIDLRSTRTITVEMSS